ncbi:MAG TPA: phosphoenolpyruvate synthase [Bacteroidetes bacterium]|nr:phosphoenolpyruvate synthase [Bacteroidota bacterium]
MSPSFSTKARTLDNLRTVIVGAKIAPLVFFTVEKWGQDSNECLASIHDSLGSGPFIVRSSCGREDGSEESNAGAFLSLLHIDSDGLRAAINSVIEAYGTVHKDDEVLVQPMLSNVVRSGVAFSHDPNTNAPYRVINWAEGADTAQITGGNSGRTWQQAALSPIRPPLEIEPVTTLINELLVLFDGQPVDCEFAISLEDGREVLWLLQARPLVLKGEPEPAQDQSQRLSDVFQRVRRGMQPHPFLMGRSTVFGVMPDWNPAEIVGVRPRPLALSLYRELVTDSIWAYQRHNYGYRNLRSFPLMPHFFGLPYIDVRLSFNSFIPADLSDSVAGRLVDYYIERLLAEPKLHDKVEFEIVFSCYTLDLPERLNRLSEAGFATHEREAIAESLRQLTSRIVHPKNGLWKGDAAKIDVLNSRREQLYSSGTAAVDRLYWLLEDAKRYGTLPFAGLARAGFVAVQMLKSLVAVGVFTHEDYDRFMSSVSTVSGQLGRDRATLDRTMFLARYGHLRPGTYDILSPRYDEAPELYFDWNQRQQEPEASRPFSLTLPQMRQLVELLDAHNLDADPVGLLNFMQAGIELRESAKFHFTRNLSDALVLMTEIGQQCGFSRDDLSYADVNVFRELAIAAANPRDLLQRSIDQGMARYQETSRVVLPPLIAKPEDVWGFEWPDTEPNFITQKSVTAPVVGCQDRTQLAGAIVCIPNADPGFDWLFAYPIAGLVTAWGGANSHMAIRAGELGLPAVIGAGEMAYRDWSQARRLHIDCAGRRVEVIS